MKRKENPKPEIRNPKETRMPNSEDATECAAGNQVRVSDFRFRICGLIIIISCATALALLPGCAGGQQFIGTRPFDFQKDTFAYANELTWVYHYDAKGKWVHERREPRPDYHQHCFVVTRSARQFFQNAEFDPTQPIASEETYCQLIRRVVSIDPDHPLPDSKKVVIPGYGDLREFSAAQEKLLKAECGGAWQSYFQRGHWRMIFPFSRAHQARTAQQLLADLGENRPPVIHVVRFPQLTINHSVLVIAARETENEIVFSIYDPNKPGRPKDLTYDRRTRTFNFPGNDYWPGGRVDVYEIYRKWDY